MSYVNFVYVTLTAVKLGWRLILEPMDGTNNTKSSMRNRYEWENLRVQWRLLQIGIGAYMSNIVSGNIPLQRYESIKGGNARRWD